MATGRGERERALRAALAGQWEFVPPPEAPVFSPSREDFHDPLAYIARIRQQAEPYGICRIKPPSGWQPPFALDVDSLEFTPRIMRPNELEGLTRLKLHFRDRLQRYWQLRAKPYQTPEHSGKQLDLFALYHCVELEGGHLKCTTTNKWAKISSSLGFKHSPEAAAFVQNTYMEILAPFQDLLNDKTIQPKKERKPELKSEGDDEKPPAPAVAPGGMMRRIRKQQMTAEANGAVKCNRELRRLACYGAGPKMPGCKVKPETPTPSGPRRKRPRPELDPLAVHECTVCSLNNNQQDIVTCDMCSDAYHISCMKPPMKRIPEFEWRCYPCIADEIRQPPEPFGFTQANRTYTLQEFGTMADDFKSEYFAMPGHRVSSVLAEKEFWKIASNIDVDVTVEYGADLHSMDHGSGFPTKSSRNVFPGDQEYVDSGWNLNNLPVLDNSVLRFVNDDISGMTVPWMYVGMCFSAFCWHNEDHWSYSINYLHWGDMKTWYGVPGKSAELLEKTMKSITPDLFSTQPDLLHQLVTIYNPNILSDAGVPVFRTDQTAGDFVVTFPRSYHAGFNQGYNFAEAVNFAPPDWLPIGRECVLHYKSLKRLCVFSHDELICKMALIGNELDLVIVIPTYKELVSMIRLETQQRGNLLKRGVNRSTMRHFELLSDDERLCDLCKTTCFLSSVNCETCHHTVCLEHVGLLCNCSSENQQLLYRYSLKELHVMLNTLKGRIESFDRWMTRAKKLVNPNTPLAGKFDKMRILIGQARSLKIPKCRLLERLNIEYGKLSRPVDPVVIELDD